jgi:uncharacterized protein (TIGR02996 family)
MSDNDVLLRAILDDPDDDAPRLVYADWLEEHGEAERAEFIRVQVERAEAPRYAPPRIELRRRRQSLPGRLVSCPVTVPALQALVGSAYRVARPGRAPSGRGPPRPGASRRG